MDVRIVNTCDSDCIYCLEQSLRNKKKYIQIDEIILLLQEHRDSFPNDRVLAFYGGNPLLHPELTNIIARAKSLGFLSISLLSNTQGLNKEYLQLLQDSGLTGISFYYHSLEGEIHTNIVQDGILLSDLQQNISMIQSSGISYTCIIHVHQQNIQSLYKIVVELYVKFSVKNFEFIRVRLLSRAKKNFSPELEIPKEKYEIHIHNLMKILKKTGARYRFTHFENM